MLSLLVCTQLLAHALAQSVLFDFGAEFGDDSLPPNDDDFSDVQLLPVTFRFFGQPYNRLYVNTNGIISFNEGVDDYTPDPFPVADYPIIAAFWGDVDTRNVGEVYFRLVETGSTLQHITSAVRQSGSRAFLASYAYIATWYDVPKFPGSSSADRSTFQAVIATDGVSTFVIYNYVALGWTPAQVGFDAGDDTNFYAHEWSLTSDIVRMPDNSNVGVTGRWIFRVDLPQIIEVVEPTPGETPGVTTLAETTSAGATAPATTIAETTRHDTTIAETTLKDTTVAETTLKDTTVAETTLKDTTVAETTQSDTTPSDTTLAKTTVELLEETTRGQTTLADTTFLDTTFVTNSTTMEVDQSTEHRSTGTTARQSTAKVERPILKMKPDYPLIISMSVLVFLSAMAILISCLMHRKKEVEEDTSNKNKWAGRGEAYDMELVERQHAANSHPPPATDTYHRPS